MVKQGEYNGGTSSAKLIHRRNFSVGNSTVLDAGNKKIIWFNGQPVAIATTWEIVNDSRALTMNVQVKMNTTVPQIFPPNVFMQNWEGDWNPDTHVWTPPETGDYEMEFTKNGSRWLLKIYGPF